MPILKNLKKFREDNDLSQKEMAKILGISQTNLNRYENGLRSPGISLLRKIIQRINISGSFLLDCDDQKKSFYISQNVDFSIACNFSFLGLSKKEEQQLVKDIILLINEYKTRKQNSRL